SGPAHASRAPGRAMGRRAGSHLQAVGQVVHRLVDLFGGPVGSPLDLAAGRGHGGAQGGAGHHPGGHPHKKGAGPVGIALHTVRLLLTRRSFRSVPLLLCPENAKNSLLNPVASAIILKWNMNVAGTGPATGSSDCAGGTPM